MAAAGRTWNSLTLRPKPFPGPAAAEGAGFPGPTSSPCALPSHTLSVQGRRPSASHPRVGLGSDLPSSQLSPDPCRVLPSSSKPTS